MTSIRHENESPDAAASGLVRAWRTITRRAKAKYGYKSIPFLAVFEATKQGWPHLHILARVQWLDQGWLSEQMEQLTGSPIVWITRIQDQGRAGSYCAKYVGKDPQRFQGVKRYWESRDYQLRPRPKKDEPRDLWEERFIVQRSVNDLLYEAQEQGIELIVYQGSIYWPGHGPPQQKEPQQQDRSGAL